MGEVYYTPKLQVYHEGDWLHRGHLEGPGKDLFMGKYGPSLERLMARAPHRVPPRESHPSSQDYLVFALGG